MTRVLVVDDAAFVRMRTTQVLERAGYSVDSACDGAEAVERYEKVRPDLVILDITMPVMDGITALREIRALDGEANVVMVTAMGQQPIIADALKAGARDFVVKPIKPERLVEVVERFALHQRRRPPPRGGGA